uniref:tetratricopeptide repeat protein n=2 Tax=Roseivirga sp. TaxID=1964215 RepID=UPI0040482DB1
MEKRSNNNESHFYMGMKYHELGDLMQAELHYREAIAKGQDSAKAKNYLGMIYFNKGDTALATRCWKESIQADPIYIEPIVNMALINSQQQNLPEALNYFKKAIKINPKREDLIQQAAQLAAQTGDLKLAEELITPTFAHHPINPNMFLLLAQFYAQSGNSKASENTLNQLLKKLPNLPEALINLGHLHVDRGEMTKAKSYFLSVISKNPQHIMGLIEAGKFLTGNGELEKGTELLQKALKLQPTNFEIYVLIGNVDQQHGNFEAAAEHYKKALALAPNNVGVKQSLSRVLSRFVPPWHLKMLADHERNDAFEKAIKKAINANSVVLDIGTGSGLLSMMAAKYGAKQVFSCETSPHIAEVADRIIENNGFKKKVKVFNLKSTQLTERELTEKPNLIVAEIFDAGLIGEMAIPSFRHALKELCAENCQVIPAKAQVMGRLLHLPSSASVNPMKSISGFDLSPFDLFRVPKEYISEDLKLSHHKFLSDEFNIVDFDFMHLGDPIPENSFKSKLLRIEASDTGALHGVAFWFNLILDDETELSSRPDRLNNHWGQALFFFEQHREVKKGEMVELNMRFNDVTIWFEETK